MSNIFTKALAAGLGQIMSAVRAMRHPGQPVLFDRLLRRTRFDYQSEIGDGLDASVVTAPIMWVQRALPEATLALRERKADGEIEQLEDHELLALIQRPNEFYGDIALWGAIVLSYLIDGNAYLVKVRNGVGKPIELWWVPWWMMEPKAALDGGAFISHYEYTPGTGAGRMVLDPADVVHFRHGLNPRNLMKGLSPIQGVIREIFTDLESSNFIASLLRNMGVPGVVISPRGGSMPVADDVEATKAWFKQAFGGDNRGGPLVMGADTRVESFGFNPEQMNLTHGSNRAEERVCACLGIPAAVVGFGAGLEQTKVGATMEELRRLAWHNGVLPLARQLADELQRSLLPDFQRSAQQRGRRLELYWNTDTVLALQEDEDKAIERKLKELQAGAITLFEYRQETGRDADDSHRFFVRPFNLVVVPEGQVMALPAPDASEDEEEVWCGDCGAPIKGGVCPNCDTEDGAKAANLLRGPGKKVGRQPAQIKSDNPIGPDWLPEDATQASAEAIARGLVLVEALQRQQGPLAETFEQVLVPTFEGWGDEAGRIAIDVLRASGEKALETALIETKADDSLIRQIIELLNLEAWTLDLSAKHQAHYLLVARQVAEGIEQSGFATGIPDPVMREIIAQGGTRAGLIDVGEQTRAAIFQALAEGRAEGEGAQALANRIANQVEGGPRLNAQQRALLIARTETKHAQNISTIAAARANGVRQMVIFDGRFGEPRSELSHIARDGKIVSVDQAQLMAENMRPNCTLSFAPHFG
jgi:HK97 family phage portal protein